MRFSFVTTLSSEASTVLVFAQVSTKFFGGFSTTIRVLLTVLLSPAKASRPIINPTLVRTPTQAQNPQLTPKWSRISLPVKVLEVLQISKSQDDAQWNVVSSVNSNTIIPSSAVVRVRCVKYKWDFS